MSSQVEKLVLVPKLRFPECRNTKWVGKLLGEVAPLQRGFDLPSDMLRHGKIPVVYSNGVQKYHEIGMASAPGLVTGRSGTIGKLHFVEEGEYWPHNTSLWVTGFKGNVPRFVYYLYDSIGMNRFSSGSGVPTLNRNDVHAFSSSIPESLAEQQKIADCLSSLDELIAAQARKVDALKTHKKSLMQQLFPREGETQPRLLFPDFQKGAKWKTKKLGTLLMDTPRPIDMDEGTQYSLVTVKRRYGGVVSREILKGKNIKVKSQFLVESNDFLISKRQIVHNACGLVPKELEGSIVSNEYSVLTANKDCDVRFFNYFAQQPSVSQSFMQASVGIVIEKMLFKLGFWLKQEFLFPGFEEQQRIADCLTSLDDLITFQTQALETLKTHKKGLMQQLFPAARGVAE